MCVHAEGALRSAAFNLSFMPLCWVTAANNERSVLHWGATAGTSGYSQSTSQCCGDPKKDCRLPRGGSSNQTYTRYAIEHVEHTLRAHIDFIFYTSDTLLLEEMAVIFSSCLLGCLGSFAQPALLGLFSNGNEAAENTKTRLHPLWTGEQPTFSTSWISSKKAVATTVTTFWKYSRWRATHFSSIYYCTFLAHYSKKRLPHWSDHYITNMLELSLWTA